MEGYDEIAALYNAAVEQDLGHNGFCKRVAPWLLALFRGTPTHATHPTMVDVGCGTGQLAIYFAQRDVDAIGIDCSAEMLLHARRNAEAAGGSGRARFVVGDARSFRLPSSVGLATATFNVVNHLPDEAALRGMFTSVRAALVDGGWFVFDLNTERFLRRWNECDAHAIAAPDGRADAGYVIRKTRYDGARRRALRELTCFYDDDASGRFKKRSGHTYNHAYRIETVSQLLHDAGFVVTGFCDSDGRTVPAAAAEDYDVVFVVARTSEGG
jgi:SAM-dependent methyltransferase